MVMKREAHTIVIKACSTYNGDKNVKHTYTSSLLFYGYPRNDSIIDGQCVVCETVLSE